MQWVCFAGIIFCYSYYAHLQEVLLSDKSLKLSVSCILIVQYIIAVLISSVIILGSGESLFAQFTYDDLIVAFFIFMSMNFSNKAMGLVSYPFVVLSKSAKIIPVILVGTLRGIYTPSPKQFAVAFFISFGLVIFNYSKLKNKKGDEDKDNTIGVLLVLGSLLFDGLSNTQTDKNHKKSKRDFAYLSMFYNNLFGLVLSFVIYLYEVQIAGDDSYIRIYQNPTLLFNCTAVGLAGSIGQVFIFFTVSLFDCYLLTIITTTRKFFSVVYSNFKFGHNFNTMQWVGATIVMICTFVELFSKDKKKKEKVEDDQPESNDVTKQVKPKKTKSGNRKFY